MEKFNEILTAIDDFVWGVPLMVLIMAGGLLLTIRVGLLQVRKLPLALKWMVKNEEGGEGEVSSFAALCTALSATIGTGNIVGVATAIVAGGPGALFWMVVAAFLGMATKYAEGLLAVKYRVVDETGHSLGGPFYYIEKGMGKNWKWLGKVFALFGVCAGYFPETKVFSFLFCSLLVAAMISLVKLLLEHNVKERFCYFADYILEVFHSGCWSLYIENERDYRRTGICLAGPVLCSVLLYLGGVY